MKNTIAKRTLTTAIGGFGPALILLVAYIMMGSFVSANPPLDTGVTGTIQSVLLVVIVGLMLSAMYTSLPTFFKDRNLVESHGDALHIHGVFHKTHEIHRDDIKDVDYRYFTSSGRGRSSLTRHGTLIIKANTEKHIIRHVAYVDKAYERLRDFIRATSK